MKKQRFKAPDLADVVDLPKGSVTFFGHQCDIMAVGWVRQALSAAGDGAVDYIVLRGRGERWLQGATSF
jgi:hypothetical protein